MKRKIYLVISCIFGIVFIVSAVLIGLTLHRYKQADTLYSELQYRYITTNSTQEQNETVTAPISVDFDALLKENSDIVGWLYCEDTPINYPVVQSSDNEYYLHRDLNGNYLYNGTLFADCRCADIGTDENFIIYGHNMKNSAMFGTLVKYKEQSYYKKHPVLYYLTPDRDYKIELFAGMMTTADSEIYTPKFGDSEEYNTFLHNITASSTFVSDVSVNETDQIVTLSTCSYEFGNARYVVFGKLT